MSQVQHAYQESSSHADSCCNTMKCHATSSKPTRASCSYQQKQPICVHAMHPSAGGLQDKREMGHLSVMLQESRFRFRRLVSFCKLSTLESVVFVYAKSS